MAYGIELTTTSTTRSLAESSPCRVVGLVEVRTVSGSQVVQGFDEDKGFIYISNIDDALPWIPLFSFNNSTKVFSWEKDPQIFTPNTNVDFYFIMEED